MKQLNDIKRMTSVWQIPLCTETEPEEYRDRTGTRLRGNSGKQIEVG